MFLSVAVELFLASKQGAAKDKTVRWYGQMLATLTAAYPSAHVEAVTPEMLDLWRAALASRHTRYDDHPTRPQINSRGLSVHSLHGHIRAVRTFFRFCHQRGYIDKNPSLDLRRPRLPTESPKHISDADSDLLLCAAGAGSRDYVLVLVLAATGCRVGGLAGLERWQIDLDSGVLELREKFDKVNEYYLVDQPLEVLRAWLADRVSSVVFPSSRTGEPLTESGIYLALRRLARKAGVSGPWNPHAFRHHKARELLSNGASLEVVAEILHHEDIATTGRYYARWTKEEVRQKHRKFSRKAYPDKT